MTKSDTVLTCVDDSGAVGEFYALDRKMWKELRKVQGKDKGKPYTVPNTGAQKGIIRLPSFCTGKQIRIFVEVDDDTTSSSNFEEVSE